MSDVRNHPESLSNEDLARIEAEERARREVRRRLDEEEAQLERKSAREKAMRPATFFKRMLIGFTLAVLTIALLPVSIGIWLVVLAVWALIKFIRK